MLFVALGLSGCPDDGGEQTTDPAMTTSGGSSTGDASGDPTGSGDPTEDPSGKDTTADDGTTSAPEGPIAVDTVTPNSQVVAAARDGDIVVTFEGFVDPATVSPATFAVFGRWSGVRTGTLAVEDDGQTIRFTPDAPLFAGEWVTVTLSRNLASASGQPLALGYQWGFWAAGDPGTLDVTLVGQRSTRLPGEGWIQSYGAYAGDLDHDGDSDLMIPNEQADDARIFLNDGAGGFPDFQVYPIPGGSVPSTNEGADFDMDGHTDFAIGSAGGPNLSVFMGAGDGTVMHHDNYAVGQSVRGVCVLDLDGDGDADMVSASRTGASGDGDISVLHNDGTGVFTITETINPGGVGETACATGDANGDGLMDVFIGALQSNQLFLYLSDGEGSLSLADTLDVGGAWMLATGDIDGDGNVDAVGADFAGNTMTVVRTDGAGGLMPADSYGVGSSPLAIDLGDVDGDGDLDAITSNFSGADFTLYENDGAGGFGNARTLPATSAGSCAIIHDRDGDGDVDITAIDELDDIIFFFDNAG
ncbi:MAG: FG-GAP-like repeat-containing protein [Deltaproteobacteria bacterium]|nr:FG-GAP-like repeat-containing protein [Deltaproteobacteria bacterium]